MNSIPEILEAIHLASGIEPQPFSSKTIQRLPSISYVAYKQGDNGVIQTWRFQLRITAESLQEAIEIEDTIAKELITLGDEEKHGALKIEINGGGTIEDQNTGLPQQIVYYDISFRSN